MALRRSIRMRRSRKRIKSGFELQLTSMMDVLVIILVFLLKSYATTQTSFQAIPGLELPISQSADVPFESLSVVITPEAITFENERVVDFVQTAADAGSSDATYAFKRSDLDEGGRRVTLLYEALMKAREKSELLRARSKARDADGKPLPFDGVLSIQADKRIQYDTVRKILYTAASAGYRVFRFIALQKDS